MTFLIAVGGIRPRHRHPGADDVVRTSVRCGFCLAPIGEGEVYALVTDVKLTRCVDCALAVLLSAWTAQWDAHASCPWPMPAMPAPDFAAGATSDVRLDFYARLRAACERAAHRAA